MQSRAEVVLQSSCRAAVLPRFNDVHAAKVVLASAKSASRKRKLFSGHPPDGLFRACPHLDPCTTRYVLRVRRSTQVLADSWNDVLATTSAACVFTPITKPPSPRARSTHWLTPPDTRSSSLLASTRHRLLLADIFSRTS
jgi:hypothetical protein